MILSFLVSIALVLVDISLTVSSLNDDGLALLSLKPLVAADPTHALANWSSSDSTPCFWTGVSCSESLDRVVSLSLPNRKLAGSLPPQLGNLSGLRHLNLRKNEFGGGLPPELFRIKRLQSLVLSENSLSGLVPSEIGNLGSMKSLDLSRNRFSGSIPSELGNLLSLQGTLDLSHNSFEGPIPASLGNLPEELYIDLSYNNLRGQIPDVGIFLDLGPTAFAGNPMLCGHPLKSPCPTNGTQPVPYFPSQNSKDSFDKQGSDLSKGMLILIVLSSMIVSCFAGWGFSCWCKKPETPAKPRLKFRRELIFCQRNDLVDLPPEKMDQYNFVSLDPRSSFDLEKLLRASAFLLGKSGIGMVYRVVLEDGQSLAVRRLGEGGGTQRLRDFQTEVEAIAKIKHPNVVPLKAYCWSEDEKLLIYAFIPNRDLATAIHGKAGTASYNPLSWAARLRIIKGIAKGLAYLHEFSPKRYIHGDLKPSNILLGNNMQPYISDFGLARLASITGESSRVQLEQVVMTTPELQSSPYELAMISSAENLRSYYQAPEAANSSKPSQKWDIYSFGMILLETITGKLPVIEVGPLRFDLIQWVESGIRERVPLSDIVDPILTHDLDKGEEMGSVLRIALACVNRSPDRRPSARHALNSLDKIGQIN
ncbi:hypothetical protein CDL15_Pgr027431 [Punica granatum]|uniref:non-specific serine/threonine protein kinase n=1 Tax=Punica granatum TaxID=22663 RepID=A0A218XIA0_PUNGR|nr:hypothetical protein CDL15_Pgr027431 [Punica granatum]